MKLKPLGDRLIVKPAEKETMTKEGIIIPDTVEKEKKEEGEVVSIGNGEKIIKLGLKPGDKVLFGKYAGEDITVDKIDYKVLEDKDVLAVVE